jgi:O-glycosyl hydrolase
LDPEEGMGFNVFRICIGTSDFSDGRAVSDHPQGYYTYQEDRSAPFSIQNDIDLKIIETLKMVIEEAEKLNLPGGIKFFASIWSPPAWMKTSNSLVGGTLKEGYETELARYFRNFIEAYEDEGIPIFAITVQNEPNFLPQTYPGMRLSPEQEKKIVQAIHKEFRHGDVENRMLNTKIWINDHNMNHWKNADKVLTQLRKEDSKNIVDGVAFHHYNPRAPISNMTKLHNRHPEIDIHLTEHAEWGVKGMYNIQQYFRHWSRTYAYWVPATTIKLDEHNQGPYNKLGDLSPTIFIKDNDSEIYVTPEYYLISQFSKFIRPGAMRIGVNPGDPATLTAIAFQNPDGNIVQVLINQSGKDRQFITQLGNHYFEHKVPAKSVGTYVW